MWQSAVPLVSCLHEGIGDACPDAYRRMGFDTHFHGDGVSGFEADAMNIPSQPIGVSVMTRTALVP
jgi:hypothetical protein